MADLQDYAALFGDDFGAIAEAFEKGIPDELENLLVSVIDDIAFAASGFATQMTASINTMLSSGMSVEFVEDTLRSNLQAGTGPFASLKKDIKKACTRGVNQSSRLGQYQTYFTAKELNDLVYREKPKDKHIKRMKKDWGELTGFPIEKFKNMPPPENESTETEEEIDYLDSISTFFLFN